MTTFPINPLVLSGFGYVVIPEWHYEDLRSENEIKRDRIQQLELTAKDKANRLAEIQSNSDRQKSTIQQLQKQVKTLEENQTFVSQAIDSLEAQNVKLLNDKLKAQSELDAIKSVYQRTLATNAELDGKLQQAISDLSQTEQKYNELTVAVGLERTARAIAIENHRRDVLMALDNLEISQKAS